MIARRLRNAYRFLSRVGGYQSDIKSKVSKLMGLADETKRLVLDTECRIETAREASHKLVESYEYLINEHERINSIRQDKDWADIQDGLSGSISFDKFYVSVYTLMFKLSNQRLMTLRAIVDEYYPIYGESVLYLGDAILFEYVHGGGRKNPRNDETLLKKEIMSNLSIGFPHLTKPKTEYKIDDSARCDIFAYHDHIPVIIELKVSDTNPTAQLLRYRDTFVLPCKLIAITTSGVEETKRHPDIEYHTLSELRDISGWKEL